MSVVAIVAEYNPFHNGHAYHLAKAKELTRADHALVIMSGDFVQRGSAAIMDKYMRTELALKGGADCVLELPFWIATAPALDYAMGAVRILNALNCVNYLCFGAESADLTLLKQAARIFTEEPEGYQVLLQEKLKGASSYAKARQEAYEEYTGTDGAFLAEPNNILAISYLQALLKLDSDMIPVAVQREGSYHNTELNEQFASATALRVQIRACADKKTMTQGNPVKKYDAEEFNKKSSLLSEIKHYVPKACLPVYESGFQKNYPIAEDAYWPMLQLRILEYLQDYDITRSRTSVQKESPKDSTVIYDMPQELVNRLSRYAMETASYQELIQHLSSPTYTNTRISRCMLHLLLHLTQKQVDQCKYSDEALYARILGFRTEHSELLGLLRKHSSIPVLTKANAVNELKTASETAECMYQLDVLAANLYSMLQMNEWNQEWQHEYSKPIIKIT